jgi:hypothetical protein
MVFPRRERDFLIVGGLYSVTALRENDNERATVYTKAGEREERAG